MSVMLSTGMTGKRSCRVCPAKIGLGASTTWLLPEGTNVIVGEAVGVKTQGGIMDQVIREVEIECLPGDIPSHIDADVSALEFGVVLRVKDLPHGGKVKFITNEEQAVAHVTAVKEEVVATPDAAAADAAAGPAEPEVIKKGKQDAEEGAEPEKAPPAKK